jgi:hypothetical protein
MLFILRISRTVYLCQTTLIQSIFQTQKRLPWLLWPSSLQLRLNPP